MQTIPWQAPARLEYLTASVKYGTHATLRRMYDIAHLRISGSITRTGQDYTVLRWEAVEFHASPPPDAGKELSSYAFYQSSPLLSPNSDHLQYSWTYLNWYKIDSNAVLFQKDTRLCACLNFCRSWRYTQWVCFESNRTFVRYISSFVFESSLEAYQVGCFVRKLPLFF
jgi:hypothetical protein